MSNEVLFFLFLFIHLAFPILFLKGGKAWLYAYIGINGCLMIPISALQVDVFTYTISIATIAWAPVYLITDILTEKYGKKAALGGALLSALTGFIVIIVIHTGLAFTSVPESEEWHGHLQEVYQYSVRMVLIGACVFMLSQLVDIYIYDYLHRKTGGRFLWLRNNASTLFTTFFNNVLFWWLAFGDVLEDWWSTALAAYFLTVIIALCDTPFIYLAKWIRPLDLPKDKEPEPLHST